MPAATDAAPPRRKRWLFWVLGVPAALVALAAAAVGVAVARFDPEAQKPRIAAAVEARTGRKLTLAGPVGLKFSLFPTVFLEDVSLANMPGGSRPEMAKVARAEAQFALLPLLSRRLELRRVVLRSPDILLETDGEGRPNWAFTPAGPARAQAPQPREAAPSAPHTPSPARPGEVAASTPRVPPLTVERVDVSDGRLAYRDGVTGRARVLAVERFHTEPVAGSGGVLRFDGAVALDELPVTLGGEAGGLERLFGASASSPWPVKLAVAAGGAEARVEGAVEQPLRARGWRMAVAAKVPDLSRFAATAPNVPTPPLRDLEFAANVFDPGPEAARRLPRFSDLRASVGANDLGWLWPGLRLQALRVVAPRDDAPVSLEGEAVGGGDVPMRLSGSIGSPRLFLTGAPEPLPWPIEVSGTAGAANASLRGGIADVNKGALGFDLALALRVPDLAALSPLAGQPLPPVRDLSLDARVAERGRGFAAGAFLRGLRASSSAGDAAGDLTFVVGQRWGIVGELASRRLDVDALLPPRAAPAPPEAAAPRPAPARDGRVVPDLPLPLAVLRMAEGNLRWTLDELVAGGVPMRDVLLGVASDSGRARLDPFVATLPGGRAMVRGAADVTVDPPNVQVSAQTAGFDLAPLLAALQAPRRIAGRLDLDADLRGGGRDLRAVAGGLSGHLGLALVDGALDAALLERLPAELRRILLPQGAGGSVPLACGALRVEAADGAARLRAMLLETGIGRVAGEGGVDLKTEALAVRLLPDLHLGNLSLRAPVNVSGTLASPSFGVSPEAAAAAGLGALLSLQKTPDRGLQALAGILGGGGGAAAGGPALPDCASQLAVARGGRGGPAPSSRPAAPAAPAAPHGGSPRELPKQAEEVLRGLFGRGR